MAGLTMRKRTISLVVALALAGVATLALVSWVRGIEKDAYAGVETVDVFIAKDDIPAGTSFDEMLKNGLVERTAVPRKVVSEEAVTSLTDIQGEVAAVTILKGEQLLTRRFGSTTQTDALLPIPTGYQAITVEVSRPTAVGGFIQGGNHVGLLATCDNVPVRSGSRKQTTATTTRYILGHTQVLAVNRRIAGKRSTTTEGEEQTAQTTSNTVALTLAVTPAEAEKVAFVTNECKANFTLLRPDGNAVRTTGRTMANLFS